ncbi:MAG: hypothetical protein EPN49_07305 [Rhodanobacter sp.]|nr:MAG: hypothetical protein EPN49_07305 [Rhodanobacter sp.]
MRSTKEFIYALYYDDFATPQHLEEGPDEVVFYIGRTTNPDRRLKQHRYEAKTGTEDKYVFIRKLGQKNVEWGIKVLGEVEKSDDRPWEFWYVIDFIRRGISLKNMRYGDFKRVPTNRLKKFASNTSIRNVDDLKKTIGRNEHEEQPKYKSSGSVQLRAILRSLRWLRAESEMHDCEIRKWNIYDLGEGTQEIKAEYSMKKREVAACLTPDFKEAIRQVECKAGML